MVNPCVNIKHSRPDNTKSRRGPHHVARRGPFPPLLLKGCLQTESDMKSRRARLFGLTEIKIPPAGRRITCKLVSVRYAYESYRYGDPEPYVMDKNQHIHHRGKKFKETMSLSSSSLLHEHTKYKCKIRCRSITLAPKRFRVQAPRRRIQPPCPCLKIMFPSD